MRLRREKAAIATNAMPAHSRLLVRTHTKIAPIAAGRKKNRILAIKTIMIIPTIRRANKMNQSGIK